jgi:quercetin dioxygenase-like cupin family protein
MKLTLNPLAPSNVITGRLAELSYNWLYSVRPTQTRMNVQFATQQSMMAGANGVLTFTGSTQLQPSGIYTFVTTAAPVPSGPTSHDFVNVAHGLWGLLLAACGRLVCPVAVCHETRAEFSMKETKPYVRASDKLPEEAFDWGTLKWLCNDRLSPGAAQTVGICHILPGKRNPVHYHPNCEEVLHMLSGEGEHSFDDQVVKLRAGSTIRIPAGVKHNLTNNGSSTLSCLISFSSGSRETVFLE